MTAKGIIDVYTGQAFYITIANFAMADVHLPKHQKVGEVADTCKEIVYTTDEYFSYPSGAKAAKTDNLLDAVHY